MASHSHIFSTIVLFFVISALADEARNTAQPIPEKTKPKALSDSCPEEYIEDSLEDLAGKTKYFLKIEIEKRLADPNLQQNDKKCLMSCYGGYNAAISAITKAPHDISIGLYVEAAESVGAFTFAISPCRKCTITELKSKGNFLEFQKWAKYVANDARKNLKKCT